MMNVQEWLRFLAGFFVLISVVLGATVHPAWNYFAALVAVNLIQSLLHPSTQAHRDAPLPVRGVPHDGVTARARGAGVTSSLASLCPQRQTMHKGTKETA